MLCMIGGLIMYTGAGGSMPYPGGVVRPPVTQVGGKVSHKPVVVVNTPTCIAVLGCLCPGVSWVVPHTLILPGWQLA